MRDASILWEVYIYSSQTKKKPINYNCVTDLQPLFTNTDGCCYALKYPEYRMCTKNLEVYNSVGTETFFVHKNAILIKIDK